MCVIKSVTILKVEHDMNLTPQSMRSTSNTLAQPAKHIAIKLLLFDVDGVATRRKHVSVLCVSLSCVNFIFHVECIVRTMIFTFTFSQSLYLELVDELMIAITLRRKYLRSSVLKQTIWENQDITFICNILNLHRIQSFLKKFLE